MKKKYWYRNDIMICVLCGKEIHNKRRVYIEKNKGTYIVDYACSEHFI